MNTREWFGLLSLSALIGEAKVKAPAYRLTDTRAFAGFRHQRQARQATLRSMSRKAQRRAARKQRS